MDITASTTEPQHPKPNSTILKEADLQMAARLNQEIKSSGEFKVMKHMGLQVEINQSIGWHKRGCDQTRG